MPASPPAAETARARGWTSPNQLAWLRSLQAQQLLVPKTALEEDWGWQGSAHPPSSGGVGEGGSTEWPCCAEHESKACGSLVRLCGIITACLLMGLPLLDRLDVPSAQAGHRPLSHTVLPQHPTRVLRWDKGEPSRVRHLMGHAPALAARAMLPHCKFTAASLGQMGTLASIAMSVSQQDRN